MFRSMEYHSYCDTIAELVLKKPAGKELKWNLKYISLGMTNFSYIWLYPNLKYLNGLPFCFPNQLCFLEQQMGSCLDLSGMLEWEIHLSNYLKIWRFALQ